MSPRSSMKDLPSALRRAALPAAAAVAAAIGPALWLAISFAQRTLAPLLEGAPPALATVFYAGVEEILRLGLAIAIQAAMTAAALPRGFAGLGVLSSTVLACIEHATYVAAFPTLDAYWRLGYSGPIHASAAALYSLAASPTGASSDASPDASPDEPSGAPQRMRPVRLAAAFLAAWAWHSAFNLAAATWSFPALPAIGAALNLAALAALGISSAFGFGYRDLMRRGYGKR